MRVFDPKALEEMAAIGIDAGDISAILKFGDVDFKNSEPRKEPCKKCIIEGEPKEKLVTITIKKCDTISTIKSVKLTNNED